QQNRSFAALLVLSSIAQNLHLVSLVRSICIIGFFPFFISQARESSVAAKSILWNRRVCWVSFKLLICQA
ncbi:MAG: hypothetical protein ACYT04_85925, partial [Nostoc sp.]